MAAYSDKILKINCQKVLFEMNRRLMFCYAVKSFFKYRSDKLL